MAFDMNEVENELGEEKPRNGNGNRNFLIIAGVLGGIMVIALLCIAGLACSSFACIRFSDPCIMGLFQNGFMGPFITETGLTDAGWALLDSTFYLTLAVGLVIVLIGFLRMRRWSWVMLMTWVGISMVVGLVDYFYFEQPNYVIMASDVVIAFALSQADVARIFGVRTDIRENLL